MRILYILLTSYLFLGCEGRKPSFSLLPSANTFKQETSKFNNKIDILWVIDNSGSMATAQSNVATNFNAFIADFLTKNYDFNIAIITSDAYRSIFTSDPNDSRFKDGTDGTSHTGYFVIDENTPDIENIFLTNITQGIAGHPDERSFQSLKEALNNTLNAGFLREDSFLAIINVSDEDDFSHDGSGWAEDDYNFPGLHSIQGYVNYLDALTGTSGATRRYSYNSIHVVTEECKAVSHPVAKYGIRYAELVSATGGIQGDICGDFSATLKNISEGIIQLATQFFLNRDPIIETIVVQINGALVPQSTENGWEYDAAANSIKFYGSYIPPQGATININFDPATFNE